ncbi:AfsR/SARP family transcriptional regulator [Micromonospora soli]|uniref:AfsR/SARP family transcriptional regulator n=1 Tax=Micromonospora sp. NBRC 110009 TaxID=3061627 RepID=UPI0026715F59|nr:AfsR/SARP family transcriptional regulator [Micromonospora sp. NBRC 110009]WKU01030.1 AfsR/SARP family transcriptional regulator [Micromonospora sp. NBRC 110009]
MRSGNSAIHISGERSKKLLAGLVVETNRDVTIDRLIDIVWGDDSPVTARQQIQNRLGRLRLVVSRNAVDQRIVRHGNRYQLESAEEHVDGLRFRRLCAEAEVARRRGQTAHAIAILRQGLMLWRGNAMEDVHSTALQVDAVHWEESRLRAIESLVALEFGRGNCVATIPELQSWIAGHPYHEGLHCRLSEALHEAGRTAEALAVIRDLRHRLDADLGIAPGAAVNELERRTLVGQEMTPQAGVQLDREAAEALRRALTETTRALSILTTALA